MVALTACGDDESAQERYCEAGEQLESSVTALANLDLIAEGTNGLEAAVGEVEDDINTLRETASEAAADDVETLGQSFSGLESAIAGLSGEISQENVTALTTAVQDVGTAAQGVYATLTDCP